METTLAVYCIIVVFYKISMYYIDNFKHMFYNMSYTLEKGLANQKAYRKAQLERTLSKMWELDREDQIF